jgi:hypothetical protein
MMDNQNFRITVRIDDSVEYSHFEEDGLTGGVTSLSKEKLEHVETHLENALLHVKELLSHK